MAEAGGPVCLVCESALLEPVAGSPGLCQVTSDCKPWRRGSGLVVCTACGTLQKPIDDRWRGDVEEIYRAYTIYHQSGGAEQRVFEADSGASAARSERIVAFLSSERALDEPARLLDVGCGNGSFLRTVSARTDRWELVGSELDDRSREAIEAIDHVVAFVPGSIEDVTGSFDVITLIHVLEHVLDPLAFLGEVRRRLGSGGQLLVVVPNHLENPFDLTIADHAAHYCATSLTGVLERAGFAVTTWSDGVIPRELLVLARPSGITGSRDLPAPGPEGSAPTAAVRRVDWLHRIVTPEVTGVDDAAFGIFGSSIAGTWFATACEGDVAFFVDEDPARVGRAHLGVPILSPEAVEGPARVIVALVPRTSAAVAARLQRPGVDYVALPGWADGPPGG